MSGSRGDRACRRPRAFALLLGLLAASSAPEGLRAQEVLSQPERVVTVPPAKSVLLTTPTRLQRISIGDPAVADAVVVSPREILVNGKAVGTTSLFTWDDTGRPHLYAIEVPADVAGLERQIRGLFPGVDVNVTASGASLVLSGNVTNPSVVRRISELAKTTGANIINNISAPSAQQIMLHVQFAEVNRSAVQKLGIDLTSTNPQNLGQINRNSDIEVQTLSSGLVRLFLLGANTQLEAVINALRTSGDFRSLAEPNLVTLEGQEATFLAGGEFPYPSVQGGGQQGAVTVQFKEFGVRLRFTPTVTSNGAIRLHVAPEVSSLDFANGVNFSGFQIPALLTRRTESDAELRPGQHLAIAGLLDNTMLANVDRIPFLGDIPILGTFFRSTNSRQQRNELLVVVTPYIVQPSVNPIPLPTGAPTTWPWDRSVRPMPADTATQPAQPRTQR